jgi:hypothetical protein
MTKIKNITLDSGEQVRGVEIIKDGEPVTIGHTVGDVSSQFEVPTEQMYSFTVSKEDADPLENENEEEK